MEININEVLKELEPKAPKGGKKNNQKQAPGKKTNFLALANNPMVQMAIKTIPKKYVAFILTAFVLMVVGTGTTVYGVVELIKWIVSLCQ